MARNRSDHADVFTNSRYSLRSMLSGLWLDKQKESVQLTGARNTRSANHIIEAAMIADEIKSHVRCPCAVWCPLSVSRKDSTQS